METETATSTATAAAQGQGQAPKTAQATDPPPKGDAPGRREARPPRGASRSCQILSLSPDRSVRERGWDWDWDGEWEDDERAPFSRPAWDCESNGGSFRDYKTLKFKYNLPSLARDAAGPNAASFEEMTASLVSRREFLRESPDPEDAHAHDPRASCVDSPMTQTESCPSMLSSGSLSDDSDAER